MDDQLKPGPLIAWDVPPRARLSNYPEPFASRMAGRQKRALGEAFGLSNFGVNLTRLAPGAVSALRHAHTKQDEFIYILEGEAVLRTDEGETHMTPGMCVGFRCGTGNGHQLINRSNHDIVYLEIGDRSAGDAVSYPDDDIEAVLGPDARWNFTRKDGTPY
jgi:uncharacterized cupin superfamily protein